jgi:very-short-patch-repair endonuclease
MAEGEARLGKRPGVRWTTVSHGLHRSAGASGLHEDLLAWRLVLPASGAFTHLTAAAERGWWLPPLPDDLPVFASIPAEAPRPRRRGLRVSRLQAAGPVLSHDGVPLVSAAETLLACARHLRLLDLVVLVDAALHLEQASFAELRGLAASRRKGAPALRRALIHADGRSESPWETLLRMLHVVCGVPVEPQRVVLDDEDRFVARGDLAIIGTRVLHEYDGGEHLLRTRQRKDLARLRAIERAGWVRRGYTSVEVLHQANLVLRDADRSLGRTHRPERVRAWYDLLSESLFTPTGTVLLRRRIGLPDDSRGGTGHERPEVGRAEGQT